LWLLGSTLGFAILYLAINLNVCFCFSNPWNVLTSDLVTKALETSLNGLAKIVFFESTLSWMNVIQSLQKIFNTALLFLFFLALRNRFKVK
jgi:hypothetical protein